MAIVVAVRFKKPGKVYYFDPNGHGPSIHDGDTLVVETVRGLELGECATAVFEVPDDEIVPPLRKVVRVATDKDIRQAESNREKERNAYTVCQEKILAHKIEMKLVDVEYAFDNSKIIFYFTANGRVDFRSLVKDLASVFKTRIELRQIGVRDEAKMLGGLGPCGRPICCGTFLGDFQPVSIKMAKEQNLSLNPTKISGLCGRLMCCLKYEQDNYEEARKKLPRVGKEVESPEGRGVVVDVNVLRETAKVRIFTGDTAEVHEFPADQLQRVTQADGDRKPAPRSKAKNPPDEADAGAADEKNPPRQNGDGPAAPAAEGKPAAPQRAERQGRQRSRQGRRGRGERPEGKGDRPPRSPRPEQPDNGAKE